MPRFMLNPHLIGGFHISCERKVALFPKWKQGFTKVIRKFGIVIPRSYEEVVTFDQANNNKLWQNARDKEMKNIKIAFKFLDDGIPPPPGYKHTYCFIIFDIMMGLTYKARFVAGWHLTNLPTSMTYASVVSRVSVRIAFLLAALNNLEILASDIGNVYLNAMTTEKIYYRTGN